MRQSNTLLTADYLRSRLTYDPITGFWLWLKRPGDCREVRRWNKRYANKAAGGKTSKQPDKAYVAIRLDGRSYYAHRLAWLYVTGEWPPVHIDHKNVKRSDNQWRNIRAATVAQNRHNCALSIVNTSGYQGITWVAKRQKWRATIRDNGVWRDLGYYSDPREAALAYSGAARKRDDFFCRSIKF